LSKDLIIIRGAREHNLKNLDLDIPRDSLTVITGLSGSGKSSLAFDTIYAESQRRYVESLSAYARQFLAKMDKPDVDLIEGLSPSISIEQKTTSHNPRSTVGTVTEIHDYFRLLFARVGDPFCYKCGRPIKAQTVVDIVDQIKNLPEGSRLLILAPLVSDRKGEWSKLFQRLRLEGFVRVRVDNKIVELDETENLQLNKKIKHDISVVVDRLVVKPDLSRRLTDSVELALKTADGVLVVAIVDEKNKILNELFFSERFSCDYCGLSYPDLTPQLFSFNNPAGACPTCGGLGEEGYFDPDLVVPNKNLPLSAGAVAPWSGPFANYFYGLQSAAADRYGFDFYAPFKNLSSKAQDIIFNGSGQEEIEFEYESEGFMYEAKRPFEGVLPNLNRRYRNTNSESVRNWLNQYRRRRLCQDCHGARLKPEVLAIKIGSMNITEISNLSVEEGLKYFKKLKLSSQKKEIGRRLVKEIVERLGFLSAVGLGYLTLARSAGTLSGGESQRIRLATQVGSPLVGVMYILDEPSIGLHQRDNQKLLSALKKMRDQGNTVLVVEHDDETIEAADYVVDLGPGAGEEGGRLIFAGSPKDIGSQADSLTGQYLSGQREIPIPTERRVAKKFITVQGARTNNLKNITVKFPVGVFTCVTGVSGSGKSSLVVETFLKNITFIGNERFRNERRKRNCDDIVGYEVVNKIIDIDQSPIGRTPRSNPATYVGLFAPIRDLFASLPESMARGYQGGRFSFNVKGGRCETCQGDGVIKIEMHFLPDVYVRCEACQGRRYNRDTLEIKYNGASIADVLNMTVDTAMNFFRNIPGIWEKLATLSQVGMGYIRLGQSSTTLSGGEAQRIKLSKELSRKATGRTVYILDEPTTGLHFEDIRKLLEVLSRLVDQGNTVIVIEHNLDVIKVADHVIDLGPEGGDKGGQIVAEGTPEEVAANSKSETGVFLRKVLKLGDNNTR
jgi:excinuclease ABC subunit A